MRVLVTGSRNWMDWKTVQYDLNTAHEQARLRNEILYVRHGDCETGADRFAKGWVYRMHQSGIYTAIEEAVPAEWQHEGCTHPKGTRNGQWYCKAAGPLRNQKMLDMDGEIDYVLAYPLPHSPGTRGMMSLARNAGLHVSDHGTDKYPTPLPIRESVEVEGFRIKG